MWNEPQGGTVTPEAVRLRADVAGLGSRSMALTVDFVIELLLLIPLLLVFLPGGPPDGTGTAVLAVAVFAVLWLYFPLFEWLANGQTPGKRSQKIRVVRTNGAPAGFAPIMVRNLLRIVEVYALPFIGLIAMFFSPRVQRLGDLAAGTMVIRDRVAPAPEVLLLSPSDRRIPGLDASALTEREYDLMRSFLARRWEIDPAARRELAARLAGVVRRQLGDRPGEAPLSNEELIVAAVQSYRARYAARSG